MTSAGNRSDPAAWIVRFAPLVPAGAAVLDLACGAGRHARLFLERGHPVTAVDVDVSGLDDLRDIRSWRSFRRTSRMRRGRCRGDASARWS